MILAALFLRPMRRAPLRFLATVVGVAAGVAELVATLAAGRAALASLREGVVEIAGRSRLEITAPGGVDEALLGTLRSVARDAVILPVVEELVLCPALDDTLRLVGIDALVDGDARALAAHRAESAARTETGVDPEGWRDFLRGEGAWIPAPLARTLGLSIGDTLAIEILARPVGLRILGEFELPAEASAFASTVWIDVALAQELARKQGRLDRIELVPRTGVSLEQIEHEVAALLPTGVRVAEPAARQRETAGMVRSLQFNLIALSGIAALVGGVLVATTLATSVVERRTTVALLRSLGAAPSAIVRAILVEAACIGCLGGALGVAAGFLGARAISPSMRATLSAVVAGAPPTPIRFDGEFALAGFGLAIAVALGAAVLPVLEALRTPPLQNLKRERPAPLPRRARIRAFAVAIAFSIAAAGLAALPALDGLPIAALAAALCVLSALFALCGPAVDLVGRLGSRAAVWTPLRLACATLSAGRRRAAWAAGAVGVALALAISIATMVTSFRTTVIEWTERGVRADLSIRPHAAESGVPIGRLHSDVLEIARAQFGTDAVDAFYTTTARALGESMTLACSSFEIAARHTGLAFVDAHGGRTRAGGPVLLDALHRHGAVVNEAFARRFDRRTGDRIHVDVGGQSIEREIVGVFVDYGDSRGLVIVDRADYQSVVPGDGPRTLSVFLPGGTDVQAARRELGAALDGRFAVDVLDNQEIRGYILHVFENTFAITRALQLVASIVAVLAVSSVLFALVSERRAELALLSAIGASRWQVGASVCLQAGALGVIGAIGGALAGLGIGFLLVTVVQPQSFHWTLEFVEPWNALATTPGAVVIACIAAGLWPAVRATRASLYADLREDG